MSAPVRPLPIVLGLLLVMTLGSTLAEPSASEASPATDPFEARAYEVHYRSLNDAADLVGELLSTEGTLTLQPRLKILVVEDHRSILDRVASLLESFDIPPRAVEVTLSLFMGRRGEEDQGDREGVNPLSREIRGVIESMRDLTRWNSYEALGTRSITGVEGEPVEADITPEYRVQFVVEAVHEGQQKIKFERFSLLKVSINEDGLEETRNLYTAGMVVAAEKLNLMVAASAPDSNRALFLALEANPR